MSEYNRRDFLKGAGNMGAALGLATTVVPNRAFGANDKINVGVIGVGGRGTYVGRTFGEVGKEKSCPGCGGLRRLPEARQHEQGRARDEVQHQGGRVPGLPRDHRAQRHRRGDRRHAGPLARPDRHRGDEGRQGRLLRKADVPHRRGSAGS